MNRRNSTFDVSQLILRTPRRWDPPDSSGSEDEMRKPPSTSKNRGRRDVQPLYTPNTTAHDSEASKADISELLKDPKVASFVQLLVHQKTVGDTSAVDADLATVTTVVPGLVHVPEEEEEHTGTQELLQRGDDICNELKDAYESLSVKSVSIDPALNDLVNVFAPLLESFNGKKSSNQVKIWLQTHMANSDKIRAALGEAVQKAGTIQAQAAEEMSKIRPAQETKARLMTEARRDFERIEKEQQAYLKELQEELTQVEKKYQKDAEKLPDEDDLDRKAEELVAGAHHGRGHTGGFR